jgi:hypothetical protein
MRACKVLDELAPMGIVLETTYEDMIGALCKAGCVKEDVDNDDDNLFSEISHVCFLILQ